MSSSENARRLTIQIVAEGGDAESVRAWFHSAQGDAHDETAGHVEETRPQFQKALKGFVSPAVVDLMWDSLVPPLANTGDSSQPAAVTEPAPLSYATMCFEAAVTDQNALLATPLTEPPLVLNLRPLIQNPTEQAAEIARYLRSLEAIQRRFVALLPAEVRAALVKVRPEFHPLASEIVEMDLEIHQ